MDVYIDDKELKKLYETGESRKLKLPGNIIDKFFALVQIIDAAISINDFRKNPGIKFEKLKGYKNSYSMRLSKSYRLKIEIKWLDEQKTIGKFYLQSISKHYGD